MDSVYLLILVCCLIFSIVASFIYYNNNKYKLINLSNKLVAGWGLYKIKLKRNNDEIILTPYEQQECLYYYAKLNYEEKVVTPVNKKKIDIKFFKRNKEIEFHNNINIELFNQNILINTKEVQLSLETNVKDNVNIELKENQTPINIEEKYLLETKDYYGMFYFNSNKEIDKSKIKISDNFDNFKNDFYFYLFLIWMPTILFTLTYVFMIK